MDEQFKNTFSQHSRRLRTRSRGLLKRLQQQIEFYFGNANLQRDFFLVSKIKEDKNAFVSIDLVANFKRVRDLTDTQSMVVKAIKNSTLLQMNENLTMVRRVAPFENRNTDTRTVYVERLPHYVDHDWLKEVFKCCGDIDYISLPRYKNSGEAKGFAFIEYKSEASATKACQVFNSIYTRTNSSSETLQFPHDAASLHHHQQTKRQRSSSSGSSDNDQEQTVNERIKMSSKRLKYSGDALSCELSRAQAGLDKNNHTPPATVTEAVDKHSQETKNAVCENSDVDNVKRKKRRRRKGIKGENEIEVPPLYVIHKKEWMRLKALYKCLQKRAATKLKEKLVRLNQPLESDLKMDSKGHLKFIPDSIAQNGSQNILPGKEEFLSRKRTRKIFETNKNGLQRSPGSMGRIDQLEKAVKITAEDSRLNK